MISELNETYWSWTYSVVRDQLGIKYCNVFKDKE